MRKFIWIVITITIILGISASIYYSITPEDSNKPIDNSQNLQDDDIPQDSDSGDLDKIIEEFPESTGSGFPKDIFG